MKKRMLVLALIFALACTTAACGDPAANTGGSSASTEQQQSEASVYAYNGYDFLNDAAKSNITTETVDVVTDMENAQGLFLTYFNANKLDLIGTNLLADDCKIKIEYNGTMYEAAGKENAAAKLGEIQSLRADASIVDLHLNHSPNFVVNTAGDGGQASYDTYTYFVDKKDSFTCETAITHMDAEYKYVDGSMKITAINWQYMESWKPVEYGSDVTEIPFEYTDVTIPDVDLTADDSNAKDFTDIQRMMSYFYENNMEDVEDFFADSETATMDLGNLFAEPSVGKENIEKTLDQILDMQEKNDDKYISLYYQMDPIITISEDGNTAEGWFWSQTFEFKGKAFGNTNELIPLVRNICQIHCNYEKVDSEWKITSFVVEDPLLALPDLDYKTINFGGERLYESTQDASIASWNSPIEPTGTDNSKYASDQIIIENMMSGWVSTLKNKQIMNFYRQCMEPAEGFYMSFKTTGLNAPDLLAKEDIEKKLQSFDDNLNGIETVPSYHTVSTPCIEFSEDGTTAKATWAEHTFTNMTLVLLQHPEYAAGEIGEGESGYFNCIGKYFFELRKIDGTWYIEHWYYEPIVSLAQLNTSAAYAKGFTGDQRFDIYPEPFALLSELEAIQ